MAIKAGELFVEIGVKGAKAAGEALSGVKDWLGDLSTQGIAAKAAVIGALYAMERFATNSMQLGTNMHQFGLYTGLSTQMLQKWQYAMQQSGVSAEDVQSSIVNVQKTMGELRAFGKEPAGMRQLQFTLGGFDFSKATDMNYVMEQLRKYAQKEKNVTVRNAVMQSFGLSPQMIAGMAEFKGDISKQPVMFGKDTEDQLNRANIALMNLKRNWTIFQADITAKYAIPILQELGELWRGLQGIGKLLDQFKELKVAAIALGAALALTFAPITTAVAGIAVLIAEMQKFKEGKGFFGFQHPMDSLKAGAAKEMSGKGMIGDVISGKSSFGGSIIKGIKDWLMPTPAPVNSNVVNKESTINYTAHNYGQQSPQDNGDIVKSHMQRAARQIIGSPQ